MAPGSALAMSSVVSEQQSAPDPTAAELQIVPPVEYE